MLAWLWGAPEARPQALSASPTATDPAAQFAVVDCLLPSQMRRMGRMVTFQAPRRAVRTTASDCEIRGGEYVASDRADYRTALGVWLPFAEQGDARAQTYVGEIFEKGRGRPVDFASAREWYTRASAQGYAPAKINLAHLLAAGLGGAADPARADSLLVEATRLPASLAVGVVPETPPDLAGLQAQVRASAVALRDLAEERDRMAKLLAARQADIARLTQEVDANRNSLAAARAELAQRTAAGSAQDAALQARLAGAEQALARQTAERNAALAALDEASRTQTAELAQRQAQIAALDRRIAELELDKKGAWVGVDMLSGITGNKRKLDAVEAELAAKKDEAAAARTALGALELRTRQQTEKANAQLAMLQASLAAASAERERLAAQAREQQATIARQGEELKAREASLAAAERRLGELRTQLLPAGDDPVIEMIEPTFLAVRGEPVSFVVPSLQARPVLGRVKSRDPLRLLTVNGAKQSPDATGLFQVDVPITGGATPVQIAAVDTAGRRAQFAFELRRQQGVGADGSVPVSGNSRIKLIAPPQHALLIANSRYQSLPGLKTPRADVEAMEQVLRERYGFKVTILYDATRYQMLSALNDLRQTLNDKDDLLVYYAGHGHKLAFDGRERGYWLPIDAEEGNPANWISTLDVTDMLASINVHKILLISDSCYSGLLTRGLVRLADGSSATAQETFLKAVMDDKSRNVLTSGSDLPVLDGGGGANSIFARALIRVLKDNTGPLLGQDVARQVQQAVNYAAQGLDYEQRPQYGPLSLAGHESGDYVFVPRP